MNEVTNKIQTLDVAVNNVEGIVLAFDETANQHHNEICTAIDGVNTAIQKQVEKS